MNLFGVCFIPFIISDLKITGKYTTFFFNFLKIQVSDQIELDLNLILV